MPGAVAERRELAFEPSGKTSRLGHDQHRRKRTLARIFHPAANPVLKIHGDCPYSRGRGINNHGDGRNRHGTTRRAAHPGAGAAEAVGGPANRRFPFGNDQEDLGLREEAQFVEQESVITF